MRATHPWHIGPPPVSLQSSILALLPRLADFDFPEYRDPRHLWEADAALINDWFAGTTNDLHLLSATAADGELAGIALFALRAELLTAAPSAHLEALAVSAAFEGRGVASALLDASHARAQKLGAESMSLHVFDTNARALELYQHKGYLPELRRCVKWFDKDTQ